MEELGRRDPVGGRSQARFVPGQPCTPGCLTSGNSASSPSRDGSGLRCSAQVLDPRSCRKLEIRGAELLRLLRAEPRLLKKTAAPGDCAFGDRSGRWDPEPAPSAIPSRVRRSDSQRDCRRSGSAERVALRSPRYDPAYRIL